MHLYVFYHRLARSWTVYIFILRLSDWPFSGLVGEVEPPPVKFTPNFWSGCHLPIGFVLFLKVCSKYLGLSEKIWGLRFIIEGSPFNHFVWRFPEKALKLSENLLSYFPHDMDCLSRPISLRVSTLVSGFLIFDQSFLDVLSRDIAFPLFSCDDRGYRTFGGTASFL